MIDPGTRASLCQIRYQMENADLQTTHANMRDAIIQAGGSYAIADNVELPLSTKLDYLLIVLLTNGDL